MKKIYILLFISFFYNIFIFAQNKSGFGFYQHSAVPCITPEQEQKIEQMLARNRAYLLTTGKLKPAKKTRVSFTWPLQMANGVNYCNYYGISNYVDHDANYPNQLLDYNCGTRTYDLQSGYNHGGVDIFLWPFPWKMKNNSEVEVIAAAPGVITGKLDGNTDNNCDFSNPNWNAVYIEHADGTVAWYGHMKNGSLTNKVIGNTVVAGEKLGVVASSGSSTGPHLHFEVHDALGNVLDPYAGACNPAGSLWSAQQNYYEPSINAAFTHDQAPVYNNCPQEESTNLKDTFYAGDDIYFSGYFRDQQANTTASFTVKRPDNSTFDAWTNTPNVYYPASYWWWSKGIPANPQYGKWNFQITFNGHTCSHDFWVLYPVSVSEQHKVKSKLRVYPNPANGRFTIQPSSESKKYLFNSMGQLLMCTTTNEIDITGFPKGIYFLKSENEVCKVVLE